MRTVTIYNDPISRAHVTEPWVYWDRAFTPEEIDRIVEFCDAFELQAGTTTGGDTTEVRKSKVRFHTRTLDTAWIFDKLNFVLQAANEMFYGFQLNGFESFQYTTYEPGEKYDWHMDMGLGRNANAGLLTRKLSMTLLLNDGFEGGEFQVNLGTEPDDVPVHKGRAIVFPSFVVHRVTPVTKGVRKSLVVWCLGDKFT